MIVGGVAAGASTGARLRRLDESAEIIVLERDGYVSFANCGLPYHVGGAMPDRERLLLKTPESLARSLALDVRTGQEVLRIDREAKEVEVRDLREGRAYRGAYDKLVLCPGAEPVRPPIPVPTTRVSTCCGTSRTWIASSPGSRARRGRWSSVGATSVWSSPRPSGLGACRRRSSNGRSG